MRARKQLLEGFQPQKKDDGNVMLEGSQMYFFSHISEGQRRERIPQHGASCNA